MNDLRSLEGIAKLLSQKYEQTNKHKLKSRHIRRNSDSLISQSSTTPTPTTNTTTPISEYFPPDIASILSTNIQMGYYSNIPSQAPPVLLKSHSDFVREDTLNDFSDSDNNGRFANNTINHSTNSTITTDLDDECIVLNLPIETNNQLNINTNDRDYSISLAPPPSLAPLILEDDYSNNELFVSLNATITAENSPRELVMDITDMKLTPVTYEEEESDDDMELFDIKNDYMQHQSKNTIKNAFNNIGNGASGIVRKAFHYRSCLMVAIKQLRSKQTHEMQAFVKEAKLYKQFQQNKNIININEYGKDINDGDLYIALQYMDLGSIDKLKIHLIEEHKKKELIVCYIMYNILNGLNDLHQNEYVHNDIKPANILSNKYGEIKLSDFGTVLKLDDKHSYLTKNNGTQAYQSPEKLSLQKTSKSICKYSTKTDIWSLGITAYELLFGSRNHDNELAYVTNPPSLTPKKHNLSMDCCDFVSQCLIYDDKQRPSANDLLAHKWFKNITKQSLNNNIWPWLVTVNNDNNSNEEKELSISPSIHDKKHNMKRRSFTDLRHDKYYNEDLLFMISALIINYSKQNVNLENNKHNSDDLHAYELHRRISQFNMHNNTTTNNSGYFYTDYERIKNMAHYALCNTQMVIQRIRVTVAYIKSQLNKTEVSRIDS